ncbi:MAG: DUF1540 domain-containing protein [Clostridium sp.]
MNRLSCNVNKCNHNLFGMCEMNRISVHGKSEVIENKTVCNSFEKRKIFKKIKHLGEIKIFSDRLNGVDFMETATKLPQIDCRVEKCAYNDGFICNSNIVFISGFKAKCIEATNCETFKAQSNK